MNSTFTIIATEKSKDVKFGLLRGRFSHLGLAGAGIRCYFRSFSYIALDLLKVSFLPGGSTIGQMVRFTVRHFSSSFTSHNVSYLISKPMFITLHKLLFSNSTSCCIKYLMCSLRKNNCVILRRPNLSVWICYSPSEGFIKRNLIYSYTQRSSNQAALYNVSTNCLRSALFGINRSPHRSTLSLPSYRSALSLPVRVPVLVPIVRGLRITRRNCISQKVGLNVRHFSSYLTSHGICTLGEYPEALQELFLEVEKLRVQIMGGDERKSVILALHEKINQVMSYDYKILAVAEPIDALEGIIDVLCSEKITEEHLATIYHKITLFNSYRWYTIRRCDFDVLYMTSSVFLKLKDKEKVFNLILHFINTLKK